MIHVAFSIDFVKPSGIYEKYLATLLVSILANTSSKVTFHVFYIGTVPEAFAAHLRELAARDGGIVQFHAVVMDEAFRKLPHIDMWSPVILNKFYFPELLPNVPKVIFFDLDMIVKRDVRILWDWDLAGCCIAGVQYQHTDSINREYNSYEASRSLARRVNGGLVIMDLDRIRACCDLRAEALAFAQAYPDVQGLDEVFFNDVFFDSTLLLPSWCQHFLGMDGKLLDEEPEAVQEDVICMHYAFKAKPFQYVNGTPDWYFWRYFARACGEDALQEELRRYFHRVGAMKAQILQQRLHSRHFYEAVRRRPLYLFGTGIFARKLGRYLMQQGFAVAGFFDNHPARQGTTLYDVPIEAPPMGKTDGVILLAILNDRNNEAVQAQLTAAGLVLGNDFFDARMLFEDIRSFETEVQP